VSVHQIDRALLFEEAAFFPASHTPRQPRRVNLSRVCTVNRLNRYDPAGRLGTSSGGTYLEMMIDSLDRLFRYYDGTANRWLLCALSE